MKKGSFIAVIILSISLFSSCKNSEVNSNPVPKSIADDIVAGFSTDSMVELTNDRVKSYYDINLDMVEDYSIYIEGSGGFADEVAVFKAKNTDAMKEIKTSITDRISSQEKAFDGYNAEELVKIKDNLVKEKGNYVLFVISEDNDSAEKIFLNAFK